MTADNGLLDRFELKIGRKTRTITLTLPIALIDELNQTQKDLNSNKIYRKFTKSRILRMALDEWLLKIRKQLGEPKNEC